MQRARYRPNQATGFGLPECLIRAACALRLSARRLGIWVLNWTRRARDNLNYRVDFFRAQASNAANIQGNNDAVHWWARQIVAMTLGWMASPRYLVLVAGGASPPVRHIGARLSRSTSKTPPTRGNFPLRRRPRPRPRFPSPLAVPACLHPASPLLPRHFPVGRRRALSLQCRHHAQQVVTRRVNLVGMVPLFTSARPFSPKKYAVHTAFPLRLSSNPTTGASQCGRGVKRRAGASPQQTQPRDWRGEASRSQQHPRAARGAPSVEAMSACSFQGVASTSTSFAVDFPHPTGA